MRDLFLEITGRPAQLLSFPEGEDRDPALFRSTAESALAAAESPPFPRASFRDEIGRILRFEGRPGSLFFEWRSIERAQVRWFALGLRPPAETRVPFHVVGSTRKVRSTELLDRHQGAPLIEAFLNDGPWPEDIEPRRLEEEEGGMVVLAAPDRDPRPVGSWREVESYVVGLKKSRPENAPPLGFALSRPDRTLVGVLGDGQRFGIRFRQSRGTVFEERTVTRFEADPTMVPLGLPEPVRADQVFTHSELLGILESMYRFEEVPPGYHLSHG